MAEPRGAAAQEATETPESHPIHKWAFPSTLPTLRSWDLTVLSQPVPRSTASQRLDRFPGFPHLPRVPSPRAFAHSTLPVAEGWTPVPPGSPLVGNPPISPSWPTPLCLHSRSAVTDRILKSMFPSWQLSHCGMGACQQGYIRNVNWIFHWLPLGTQRCVVSLQERRAGQQGLGVGKEGSKATWGSHYPRMWF